MNDISGQTNLLWFERPPWNSHLVWLSVSVVVLGLDFVTGPYIQFPAVFILPVLLVAWNSGFGSAVGLAVLLCVARFLFSYVWGFPFSLAASVINTFMRCGVLLLIAGLAHRTAAQSRRLRQRVRQLEGILPICSFCKAICDESGNWQQLEAYVRKHSQAEFSHGVCPACAEKHYGDVLRKSRNV
jgi:K+-sensing histidine kinase KdpD